MKNKVYLRVTINFLCSFYSSMLIFLKKLISKVISIRRSLLTLIFNKKLRYDHKITLIISKENNKKIRIHKTLGVLRFPVWQLKEIIVVTKFNNEIIGAPKSFTKYTSSISEAISISTGDYLCFMSEGEHILPFGFAYLNRFISKNKNSCDIILENSINSKTINKPDYSELVLPENIIYGIKLMSRSLASKTRLPRNDIYSYFLDATDKSDFVAKLKFPITHTTGTNLSSSVARRFNSQKLLLEKRYYYSNKKSAKSIKRVLFIVTPRLFDKRTDKFLLETLPSLNDKQYSADIFFTHRPYVSKSRLRKYGIGVHISKKAKFNQKIIEINKLVSENEYDAINTINSTHGYIYSAQSRCLKKRPVNIAIVNSSKKRLLKSVSEYQSYIDKIIIKNARLFSSKKVYVNKDKILCLNDKNYSIGIQSVYDAVIDNISRKYNKSTTIAMVSYNRRDAIEKTLKSIYNNTETPFNVLVLDNGSENETKHFLKKFADKHANFKCIFEEKNLGCSGGRHKMLNLINSDYIVTIDNDMDVERHWLRDMILRLEEDDKIVGTCARCVLPWGRVQFTGGSISKDDKDFYFFNANDYDKDRDDLSTLNEYDCDWLPGGATLWRGDISDIAQHSLDYINAFEDFDYSIQIAKKGYRMVNCPYVTFIHYHSSGFTKEQADKESNYLKDRNNIDGFVVSLNAFYKRTGIIMKNDLIFAKLGVDTNTNPDQVKGLIKSYVENIKN